MNTRPVAPADFSAVALLDTCPAGLRRGQFLSGTEPDCADCAKLTCIKVDIATNAIQCNSAELALYKGEREYMNFIVSVFQPLDSRWQELNRSKCRLASRGFESDGFAG
jgi:hypothetical protein